MTEANEEEKKMKQIIYDHIKRFIPECSYDGEQLSNYLFLLKKKEKNKDVIYRETLDFFSEFPEAAKKFVDWYYEADIETMAKKRLGKQINTVKMTEDKVTHSKPATAQAKFYIGPTTKIMFNAVKDVANNAMTNQPKSRVKQNSIVEPEENLRSEGEKISIKDRIIKKHIASSDRKEQTELPAARKVQVTGAPGKQFTKPVLPTPPTFKVEKHEENIKKPVFQQTMKKSVVVPNKSGAAITQFEKPKPKTEVVYQKEEIVQESVNDTENNIQTKKKRCTYWPMCKNPSCVYHHPTEQCKKFPKCAFGNQCLYIHPQIDCKYKWNCTRPDCVYTHPAPQNRIMYPKPKPYLKKQVVPKKEFNTAGKAADVEAVPSNDQGDVEI